MVRPVAEDVCACRPVADRNAPQSDAVRRRFDPGGEDLVTVALIRDLDQACTRAAARFHESGVGLGLRHAVAVDQHLAHRQVCEACADDALPSLQGAAAFAARPSAEPFRPVTYRPRNAEAAAVVRLPEDLFHRDVIERHPVRRHEQTGLHHSGRQVALGQDRVAVNAHTQDPGPAIDDEAVPLRGLHPARNILSAVDARARHVHDGLGGPDIDRDSHGGFAFVAVAVAVGQNDTQAARAGRGETDGGAAPSPRCVIHEHDSLGVVDAERRDKRVLVRDAVGIEGEVDIPLARQGLPVLEPVSG